MTVVGRPGDRSGTMTSHMCSRKSRAMRPLIRDLLRPHRRTLLVILAAMLVETVMSLTAPWPLKAIIDNVAGNHRAPKWIDWLLPMLGGERLVHIAEAAGVGTVLLAVVTGASMYVATDFTESMGQRIGSDLRVRLYHHLQELSL